MSLRISWRTVLVALVSVLALIGAGVLSPVKAMAAPASKNFIGEWEGEIRWERGNDEREPVNSADFPALDDGHTRSATATITQSVLIEDRLIGMLTIDLENSNTCVYELESLQVPGFGDTTAVFKVDFSTWGGNNCNFEWLPYLRNSEMEFSLNGNSISGVREPYEHTEYDQSGIGTVYLDLERKSDDTEPEPIESKNDPQNVPPGEDVNSTWWDWPDRDNDGIPDYWEENGVWGPNGYLDLPRLGANPNKADLFIHSNYEQGYKLSDRAISITKKMFEDAPLNQGQGVSLHVIDGESIPKSVVQNFQFPETADFTPFIEDSPAFHRVDRHTKFTDSVYMGGGGVPQIFKWHLNYNRTENPSTSGEGFINGNSLWTSRESNFMLDLRLGDFRRAIRAQDDIRGAVFAHEIGHTLGLGHGGNKYEHHKPETDYKSVMSYAYSTFGVPKTQPPILSPVPSVDYSKETRVNYDWRWGEGRGTYDLGSLIFVKGSNGSIPDFYDQQPFVKSTTSTPRREISHFIDFNDEMAQVLPSTYEAFAAKHDIDPTLVFPRVDEPGDWIIEDSDTLTLEAHDLSGQPGEIMLIGEPENGSISIDGLTMTYTSNAGFSGTETITVRVTNGELSSEPLEIKIVVGEDTDDEDDDDNTPSPAPGGSLGGSLGSGSLGGS